MKTSIMSKSASARRPATTTRPPAMPMPGFGSCGLENAAKAVLRVLDRELVEAQRPLVPVGEAPPAVQFRRHANAPRPGPKSSEHRFGAQCDRCRLTRASPACPGLGLRDGRYRRFAQPGARTVYWMRFVDAGSKKCTADLRKESFTVSFGCRLTRSRSTQVSSWPPNSTARCVSAPSARPRSPLPASAFVVDVDVLRTNAEHVAAPAIAGIASS